MSRIRSGAGALTAAAILALPALALLPASPAVAASLGGVDVLPAKGTSATPMSLITERGCAEPAERVSAVALGKCFPDGGQIIVAPSEVLFSTTRPMELPVSNAFVIYADRNNAPLSGTYTIEVRCTDRIGVTVLDEFSTTMTWKTPGSSLAKIDQATYTAKNTAGVVEELEKQRKEAERLAAEQAEDAQDSGGTPEESTDAPDAAADDAPTGPRPGELPVDGGERPDGSNPDTLVDAAEAAAPADGDSNITTLLLLGGGAIALLTAGFLFFRGRSSTSPS
jgi:hypothetical protein